MGGIVYLKDLLIIFATAVVVVALLRRVGVPSIAGFIVAGVALGPSALSLVDDTHQVEVLAEVGVVLLLFGLGLELSIERLRRLWRAVVVGGVTQVGLTIAAVVGIGASLGLDVRSGVFLGCTIAVSSTAIVLRGLSIRGELEAPHGRLALGILVFQDLCVIPMILAVPFLAGAGGSGLDAARAALTAIAILTGVLVAARLLVPRFLRFVSETRQRDLFVLAVFLVCLGTAWAVSRAGISLALGAFLGGMVVAGSEFRHQALSDLVPVREVLASVFFVSIGMLLDLREVLAQIGPILGLLVLILGGKFVLVFLTAGLMRLPLRVCILTAASLAQVGEFSFVLLTAEKGTGLLTAALSNDLLVAIVLSMLITPVGVALGPHIACEAGKVSWLTRLLRVRAPEEARARRLEDHVVIAGFGMAGRDVTRSLRSFGRTYVVVDLNPDNVRRASRRGEPAFYGDVTSPEVLKELGIERARLLVVAINDPGAAERAIRAARGLAPELQILVRTQYDADIPGLRRAGATQVVSAEKTAAVMLRRLVRSRCESDPGARTPAPSGSPPSSS